MIDQPRPHPQGAAPSPPQAGTRANPLLDCEQLPRFSSITAADVEPAVRALLERLAAGLVELCLLYTS